MGLINAALGSAGGVLADQWRDYFYCEAIPSDVLMVKGKKRVTARSANKNGSDNIISNGSIININEGQCMMIVESGLIVDVCAEPGEYVYDTSTEPSIFTGDLEGNIKAVFQTMGKRFTFGGEAPKDQRIYFFNTKELTGFKFGTPNPVAFRVVDERAAIDIDVGLRCFGTYSIKLVNPLLFYKEIASNVPDEFKYSEIEDQMKSELLTALQPAFARISAMGVRYSALMGYTKEIGQALREELSADWSEGRGIEIKRFGISSLNVDPEDEKMLKEMQRNTAFMDPTRGAAHMVGSTASAMQTAAGNTGGAAMAFMGMGMAQGAGGVNAQNLYAMGAQQQAAAPAAPANGWKCSCGNTVSGNFCPVCGSKKPEPKPVDGWQCACGATATGKFCPECGSKKPEPKSADGWTCPTCGATATGKFCPECGTKKPDPKPDGWTCSCGTVNKGKFCAECGSKKPPEVPQYKCDKCGWEPADPTKAPKFCPECGDPFDAGDIV